MNGKIDEYVLFAARILVAQIFLVSGLFKIVGWSGQIAWIESMGLPFPTLLLSGALILEVAGGLSLLLGWKSRWGALILALYLVPTTLIFHGFWSYEGQEVQAQLFHFMKNVTTVGALMLLAVAGPGSFRVDPRPENRSEGYSAGSMS